mgnify:CR=1 FL=1
MEVIGIVRSNFTLQATGKEITGCNLYLARPIDPKLGHGVAVDRVYMTDAKLEANGIDLETIVGREVVVYYNRYGKVASMVVQE